MLQVMDRSLTQSVWRKTSSLTLMMETVASPSIRGEALLREDRMIYVKRDETGRVIAVSQEAMEGFEQTDESAASEINEVLASATDSLFQNSDLEFIRVLDDVIDLLIAKNLLLFTELPAVVQEKYTQRTQMRERRRESLNLLEDEEIL